MDQLNQLKAEIIELKDCIRETNVATAGIEIVLRLLLQELKQKDPELEERLRKQIDFVLLSQDSPYTTRAAGKSMAILEGR